jgi:hypothetical protein
MTIVEEEMVGGLKSVKSCQFAAFHVKIAIWSIRIVLEKLRTRVGCHDGVVVAEKSQQSRRKNGRKIAAKITEKIVAKSQKNCRKIVEKSREIVCSKNSIENLREIASKI